MRKLKNFIDKAKTKPGYIIKQSFRSSAFKWLPDAICLKILYELEMGRKLKLKHPETFNEKLQWLKLHDRNPEYIKLVDKYEVRKIIRNTIGEQYLIPLLGVYKDAEEIDWEGLPDRFVMKCTHGSGCNIICTDKSKLDIPYSKKKLKKWMKANWYYFGREWPYKNVKPRIICEKYMVDESGTELKDYKIFCFNGEPRMIQVDYNRFEGHKRNLYDTEWNYIEASIQYPTDPKTTIEKPDRLEDMLGLARVLSKDYPHVRTDFYYINDRIYFGEITFYHGAGYEKFAPEEFGLEVSEWLNLPLTNSNIH